MSTQIEKHLARQDWKGARRLIRQGLRKDPESHWLLTRLSLTYYEERDYARALEISDRALAPRCPLVLWDHAGTLEMLGRTQDAMRFFRRMLSCGVERLANGPCGEGTGWARGLRADALYRLSACYAQSGKYKEALRSLEQSIS